LEFNIIATVGTDEVDLAPVPGGSATVPADKYRKVYVMVLNNQSSDANTLTLNIYKGGNVETTVTIALDAYATIEVVSEKTPILIVPPGRTFKAVAGAKSVSVLMTCRDE